MTNSETFLKDIKTLPLLTAKRERELGIIIQKHKPGKQKSAAIVELVEHNIKLAVSEAYSYSRRSSVPVEELYNAGKVGLIRAAYDYNPQKFNTRFSTYATPWIRQGIREIIHGNGPVKIPLHIINGLYRKKRAVESNGEMTDKQIRNKLELTQAQLDRINKANVSSISLNTPLSAGHEKDGFATLGDVLPDANARIPGEDGLNDSRYDFLFDAMDELDEVSRDIVKSQVLNADKVKLSDLGSKYGITGERVRQIKEKALRQLKKKIVCCMSLNGLHVPKGMIESLKEPPKKKLGRPKKSVATDKAKKSKKKT